MLEGSLGDFSLPDIFRLIALTKKTGALSVRSDACEGRVLFHGGEVTFAVADVRRVAIGARLVAAGLVEEAQVTRVLEGERQDGDDLLVLLLEESDLDESAVNAFLRDQIEDAVFDLMRLDTASFSFDTAAARDDVGLTVSTEQLIEEGSRRLDEWASIRTHVPSTDAVLALAPDPRIDGDAVSISIEDWRLLALVDGRRTVRDLVELTGKGEFATSKLLAGFVERGYVQIGADAAGNGSLAGMVARRDMLRRLETLELGEAVPRPAPQPPAPEATPEPEKTVASDSSVVTALADTTPETPVEVEPAVSDGIFDEEPDTDLEPDAATATEEPADTGPVAGENGNGPAALRPPPTIEFDRSQVAREFASLGLDDALPQAPPPREGGDTPKDEVHVDDTGFRGPDGVNGAQGPDGQIRPPLTRDEDVNKGLLLRLIDGVKGA